jgi:hypothetical protein
MITPHLSKENIPKSNTNVSNASKIPKIQSGAFVRYYPDGIGNGNDFYYAQFVILSDKPTDGLTDKSNDGLTAAVENNIDNKLPHYDSTRTKRFGVILITKFEEQKRELKCLHPIQFVELTHDTIQNIELDKDGYNSIPYSNYLTNWVNIRNKKKGFIQGPPLVDKDLLNKKLKQTQNSNPDPGDTPCTSLIDTNKDAAKLAENQAKLTEIDKKNKAALKAQLIEQEAALEQTRLKLEQEKQAKLKLEQEKQAKLKASYKKNKAALEQNRLKLKQENKGGRTKKRLRKHTHNRRRKMKKQTKRRNMRSSVRVR